MRYLKLKKVTLFFLIAGLWLSTARADQVALKNGDRITGGIVKMDGKNLTIKSDKFGVVVVPRDQIESIAADKPLNFVLKDGRTIQGILTAREGKAEVAGAREKISMMQEDIVTIRNDDEQKEYLRLLHPGWGKLWSGTGTVGFAGAAGNARTITFTVGVNASRVTRTDKTSVYFSAIKSSALVNGTNSDTAQAVRGGVAYDHNANARFFFNVFNDYEYDRFQNLDLRFVVGGGMGFHAVKSGRSRLDLVAGGAYSRSRFSTPLIRNSGEIFWGNEYSLKLNKSVTLTQSYRMFNNMTETGAYRVNFDLGLATRILSWLSWNVSVSDRYLSNPAPGRKTNDLLYTTGVGITFTKK